MKLNHINLVVTDVADAISFFETFFDFRCVDIKGDNVVAVLHGTDGFILVLMSTKEDMVSYPTAFHIGFMLDSSDQVIEAHSKLKSHNIAIEHKPRKIRDSFGFYFRYDNIMIEVGHYLA